MLSKENFWEFDESLEKKGNADAPVDDDLTEFELEDTEDEDLEDEATDDSDEPAEPVRAGTPKAAKPAGGIDGNAVKEELLKQVGGEAVIKIKGVERRVKDLSPEEIVNGLSKAFRADQLFDEAANQRRQIEAERQRLESERLRLEREFASGKAQDRGAPKAANPLFEPNEMDSPETKQLKSYLNAMQDRIDKLEGAHGQRSSEERVRGIEREVENLAKDYPMASKDEVLAVKFSHPEVNTEDLMRMAHTYYSSKEHIEEAIKHNPTFKREYDEAVVRAYLAKKQSARKIGGQSAVAGSSSGRVSEKGKKPIRDWKDADIAARAFVRTMAKAETED